MAVSRADKEQELQDLATAFQNVDTAILVDYRGLDVPSVDQIDSKNLPKSQSK